MSDCADVESSSPQPYLLYSPSDVSTASSAFSNTADIWSDTLSQSSGTSATSASSVDAETCDGESCLMQSQVEDDEIVAYDWIKTVQASQNSNVRQHPRRRSSTRTSCPPQLLRQSGRKVSFVDSLVGKLLESGAFVLLLKCILRFCCADNRSNLASIFCVM